MTPLNSGDTAFVLISAGLVFFMTPGLAFFYGGMVRRKNVLTTLMQCFISISLVSVAWFVIGYTLAFGPTVGGVIGSLKWLGLALVGQKPNPDYAATIPHLAFMIYQAMFAVITPALIIGAFAERIKFSAFLIFSLLWSLVVYAPVAHWVWGVGGWLRNLGVLDFAGGIVVHVNAGIAALVTALFMGKREGYGQRGLPPHNLPFTVLGTGILWFGWFGFNAGSALAANGLAANAFVTTAMAAAAAGLAWAAMDWIFNGTPTMLGVATGLIAGLATITPCAGFVSPISSLFIGGLASVVCFFSVSVLKPKLGYDDSLDAFGVHGVGGILGSLLVGVFAQKAINPAGADGLISGNGQQLLAQAIGVGAVVAYSLVVTIILYKLVDMGLGMRVGRKEENIGLDLTQHKETGYTVVE